MSLKVSTKRVVLWNTVVVSSVKTKYTKPQILNEISGYIQKAGVKYRTRLTHSYFYSNGKIPWSASIWFIYVNIPNHIIHKIVPLWSENIINPLPSPQWRRKICGHREGLNDYQKWRDRLTDIKWTYMVDFVITEGFFHLSVLYISCLRACSNSPFHSPSQ